MICLTDGCEGKKLLPTTEMCYELGYGQTTSAPRDRYYCWNCEAVYVCCNGCSLIEWLMPHTGHLCEACDAFYCRTCTNHLGVLRKNNTKVVPDFWCPTCKAPPQPVPTQLAATIGGLDECIVRMGGAPGPSLGI